MDDFKPFIAKVATGATLSREEARDAFDTILSGEVTNAQSAAFLMALRVRGETIDEIAGAVGAMRGKMLPVKAPPEAIDIVGTGGDSSGSYNVSTLASIITAACGVPVAKHGNRAASSRSGAADVLTALGVKVGLDPAATEHCIREAGVGFMFAPIHHPAMKVVAPVRREMGVRTIFNILGPLTNPAGAPNILMGVFHPDLVGIQARVLQRLGAERALVVWGRDGVDELSLGAATLVGELRDGKVREYEVHPEDFGIAMSATRNLKVADAGQSSAMLLGVLEGVPGPAREIVALNAAAALYVAGVATDIADGLVRARAAIDSGAARQAQSDFVNTTRALAAA